MSAKYAPNEIKAAIHTSYHFKIPLEISPEQITEVIKHFFNFLALSDEEKSKFVIDIRQDERDRGTDLGWRRRSVEYGFGYDNKEFFHYNDQAREIFTPVANNQPVAKALIESLDPIFQTGLHAMKEIIQTLDTEYPGLYSKFWPTDTTQACVIRLLKYDSTRTGEFLAKGHYDRGSCTVAIAESAPGLRLGPDDQHLIEVEHKPGQGLFFPGISLGQFTHNELLPTWHDVVQKTEAAYGPDASRWAMVLFCAPPDPNYFDRATVHTPVKRSV